jgi:TetR/AcrR family transcriptional regulator
MARPVAADHGEKRIAIRKAAARLFAEQGYDKASMAGIAQALGVSKALFYHYYKAKDDLLFDIIASHLTALVAATELAAAPMLDPRQKLAALIGAILDCYRDADHEHRIQISHLSRLSGARQAELKGLERHLVKIMAGVVADLAPGAPPRLITPLAMSLFGTLNWKFMWFRENGPVSRAEFAALITAIYADGIAGLGRTRAAE